MVVENGKKNILSLNLKIKKIIKNELKQGIKSKNNYLKLNLSPNSFEKIDHDYSCDLFINLPATDFVTYRLSIAEIDPHISTQYNNLPSSTDLFFQPSRKNGPK